MSAGTPRARDVQLHDPPPSASTWPRNDTGSDQLFARDAAGDTLDAGPGFDRANVDDDDLLTNAEAPLR